MWRWSKGLGWLLVTVVASYLGGANLALNTSLLEPLINKKPEKLLVEWESGWTLLPGVVHVEGFRVRGQSRKKQWECRLDEGTFHFSLAAFADKTIRITHGRGSGFDFRIRRRLAPDEAELEAAKYFPPIEGLTNPPDPAPEDLYPQHKTPRKKWFLDISDVELRGPAELWFGRFRVSGRGLLKGEVLHRLGETLELPTAVVELEDGELLLDADTLARDVAVRVDGRIEPFDPKGSRGTAVLRHVFGHVRIDEGAVPDLRVLDAFLPGGTGLGMTAGTATVHLDLEKEAVGEARGHIEVSMPDARLLLVGETVTGDVEFEGRLEGGSLDTGGFDLGELTLSLSRMRLVSDEMPSEEEGEVGDGDGWWARFIVEQGGIDLGRPSRVDLVSRFEAKNSDPLIYLFFAKPRDEGGGYKAPAWIKLLPNIQNLSGRVRLGVGQTGVLVDDLEVEGERLEMLGRLRSGSGNLRGQLYIHYRVFHLGVGLADGKKKLHVSQPKRWFVSQPDLDDTNLLQELGDPSRQKGSPKSRRIESKPSPTR